MFKKIVYCSPIQGQLLLNGKPLAGVQVTRTLYSGGFAGNQNIDYATSDAQGRYQFPELSERRLFRPDLLSANPSVGLHLELKHQGALYNIWSNAKQNFQIGGETGRPVIEIESDISKFEDLGSVRSIDSKVRGISNAQ